MAKGRHITDRERVDVNKVLEQRLQVIGDKLVQYQEGWNDVRVAAVVAEDLSPNSVAKFRQAVYGNLFAARTESSSEATETRVNELWHQIAFDTFCLDDLLNRFDKLCDTVSFKQVADVRYLKTDMKKLHAAFDARTAERAAKGDPPPWHKPNGSGGAHS